MTDDEWKRAASKNWRKYKTLTWIAAGATVAASFMLIVPINYAVRLGLWLFLILSSLILHALLRLWRCPRCMHRYFPVLSAHFTIEKCQHCGLPKWGTDGMRRLISIKQSTDLAKIVLSYFLVFSLGAITIPWLGYAILPNKSLDGVHFVRALGFWVGAIASIGLGALEVWKTRSNRSDPNRFSRTKVRNLSCPNLLDPDTTIPASVGLKPYSVQRKDHLKIYEFHLENNDVQPQLTIRTAFRRKVVIVINDRGATNVQIRVSPLHWFVIGDPEGLSERAMQKLCAKLAG